MNSITFLAVLSTFILFNSNNNVHSVSQLQKIFNLKPVFLLEEFTYSNKVLYNFGLNDEFNNIFKNDYKIKILSVSTSSTSTQMSNSQLNTQLKSKFVLGDHGDQKQRNILFVNDRFDREELIDNQLCEKPTESNLDVKFFTEYELQSSLKENDCMFKIKIAINDAQNNLVSIFTLPVLVEDINDQKPRFNSSSLVVNISENLSSKTLIPLEKPIDTDSAKYSIQNCTLLNNINSVIYSNLFEISYNSLNKNLFLITNTPLDYETQTDYDLELSCYDGENEAIIQLHVNVLDANDHTPFFKRESYNLTMEENKLYENLVQIEAVDLDAPGTPNSKLTFSLPVNLNSEEISNELFKIDSESGVLSLRKPLDYEKTKKYTLKVKCQDNGATNSVPIYIDIYINVLDMNDHAPQYALTFVESFITNEERENNTIWMVEESYSPSKKMNLAYLSLSDLDTPAVNGYSLSAELTEIAFLQPTTLQKQIETDKSSLTFKVEPLILEYGNVYYSLVLINQIDREKALYYDLTIKLEDNSNTNSSQVQKQVNLLKIRVILEDINDNEPQFFNSMKSSFINENHDQEEVQFYKFFVSENQLKSNFAQIEAKDPDFGPNSELEFQIMDELDQNLLQKYLILNTTSEKKRQMLESNLANSINPNYLFFVSNKGALSLRGELDREQRDFYLLTIRVNDKPINRQETRENMILVEVNILDENDNQPIYYVNKMKFNLEENMPEKTLVGSVKAIDPDLDPKIEYTIEPDEFREYFYIDSQNGDLYTQKSFDSEDLELRRLYNPIDSTLNFRVYARDTEFKLTRSNFDQNSVVNVSVNLIDLNDNPPKLVFQNEDEKLNMIDLSKFSSNETSIVTKKIKAQDMDRDCFDKLNFKLSFVRRFSWQFVYDLISKNDYKPYLNQTLDKQVIEFVRQIVTSSQTENDQSIKNKNANLRTLFGIGSNTSQNVLDNICTSFTDLKILQINKLQSGLYNLSIRVSDSLFKSDSNVKLFVFNSNKVANSSITASEMNLLNQLIENWWSQNSHLVSSLNNNENSNKKSKQSSNNNNPTSEDIDYLSNEYFKFYASAFSRFNSNFERLNLNFSSFGDFFSSINNNSSSSILVLLSAFLMISLILIAFIIFKQSHNNKKKSKNSNINNKKKMFVNLNKLSSSSTASSGGCSSTGSSFNISEHSSNINEIKINALNQNTCSNELQTSSPKFLVI
jgi:hypothetical protein